MDKIKKILNNDKYIKYMDFNKNAEIDRKFCCHDLEHALDVARIAYIINLEESIGLKKDVIYAAALLHDIGRFAQYEAHLSHHQVGATVSKEILEECQFDETDIVSICDAIRYHKSNDSDTKDNLIYILYKADKLSRNCFTCNAYDECYWPQDIKNVTINY